MANPIVQEINIELTNLQKQLSQFKSTVEYLNNAKNVVNTAVQGVNSAEDHFSQKVEELKNTYNSFITLTDSVSALLKKVDTINFPERLDSIEATVKETISILDETKVATLAELQKASEIIIKADFDGRFKGLQQIIEVSVESNTNLANTIENQKLPAKIDNFEKNITSNLDSAISNLQKSTKQIASDTAKSIHDLNLPVRIDKLDANIAGILSAVQNLQTRLENIERHIVDKITDSQSKVESLLTGLQTNITNKLKESDDKARKLEQTQKTNSYITWILLVLCSAAIIIISKFL